MKETPSLRLGTERVGDDALEWPRHLALVAGAYALGAGLLALTGWAANVPRLTDWKNDGISMLPNAAACAVMSGLAVVFATLSTRRAVVRVLATAVALVAGLTLLEHVTGANLGIDTILFNRPWGQGAAAAPMRMGPPAAVSFLIAGTALLLLTLGPQGRRASAALAVVILAIGVLSFTGHLYGASPMYTIPRLTGIAMQTASVVVALGLALLGSVPEHQPMRTLLGRDAAGMLTRRALPVIVGLALALGSMRLLLEEQGFVDAAFGTALTTVIELGLLIGLLWWAAARIRTHEQALQVNRKSAEETRALYAAIVESSDDAIISKDVHTIITSWNHGATRLFGYTAAEAIGRPVTMLIPPERVDEEPAILGRVLRGERIEHYETVRRHKDGTLLDISITVSPIIDGEGHVVGASKIARDITERRRVAAQREELLQIAQRMREEAEAANRAKDEFLAMLGHELRNPLSAVRNAITAAALDEASRERAIEIARRQTDQLVRIVDDLLDVARITQGQVRLRKERLGLAELLQRAVDGARAIMDERGHTLTPHLPPEPLHLEADAARLEQAIANLLANAAKYTDPGGTIAVMAEADDGHAVIRVRDNGIGIAPEVLARVFDLFTQGERSLERAQGGLGIGLTVVRRIVELHGGSVEARSPGLGGGAEFVIRLPALPQQADVAPAPPPREPGGQMPEAHRVRVLVAEDHPDAAESLVIILELLGHQVRVAHDGVAALEAARASAPDIMLVDIGLPGMDGYEVAQAVRREPALSHLVLVALTGYGRPEDKARALAAGFDHHLVKPVDLDALGALIAQLAARIRPSAAATPL